MADHINLLGTPYDVARLGRVIYAHSVDSIRIEMGQTEMVANSGYQLNSLTYHLEECRRGY